MQDATHMITSDLAGDACWILPHGIVGRPIEFLRRVGAAPTVVSDAWPTNPLASLVAVLALDDGLEALVLEDLGGSARLRGIEVATGVVKRTIAAGITGTPTAMAWSRRRNSVLIATHTTSGALVHDIQLEDGVAVQPAAAVDAVITNQPIRGIVAFADRVVLATAANKLLRVEWGLNDTPRTAVLLDNRSEPWGVVLDPLDRQRVFLAERGAIAGGTQVGRIAAWDLRNRLPVAFLPIAEAPERPSAIALDSQAGRLLVVSEPLAGGRVLRRYEIGSAIGAFAPIPLPANARVVAAAGVASWLVADSSARSLTAQGGAMARRMVTGYDVTTGVLTVDEAVAGVGTPARWRIRVAQGKGIAATPAGRAETFVWDTAAASGVGPVVIRGIAIDREFGPATAPSSAVAMQSDEAVARFDAPDPIDLVTDLNADGALDIKSATQIRIQATPGVFGSGPAVAASVNFSFDVDGDGRNDLVEIGSQVRMWLQTPSGFASSPTTIGIAATNILDLDGNGLFDLVKTTVPSDVRYQTAPGAFSGPQGIPVSSSVLLRDVDSDGRTDVVVRAANSVDSTLTIHRQDHSGAFPAAMATVVEVGGPTQTNPPSVTTWPTYIEDVDGDGRPDIVAGIHSVGFGEPTRVRIVWQSESGQFTEFLEDNGSSVGFYPVVDDTTDDGLLELGSVAPGPNLVKCQVGPRRFVNGTPRDPFGSIGRDIDGNGVRDYARSGTIDFIGGVADFLHVAPTGISGFSAGLGDLDGDGLWDLSAGRQIASGPVFTAAGAFVFGQLPGGQFDADPIFGDSVNVGDTGVGGIFVRVRGDVTRDGIQDCLFQTVAGFAFKKLAVMDLLSGTLTPFVGPGFYGTGIHGPFLAARLQAGVAGSVIVQNDNGAAFTFTELHRWEAGAFVVVQTLSPVPVAATCYGVADCNGDGRPDILLGLPSGGQIGIATQLPDGTFGPIQTVALTGGGTVSDMEARDVDGDGVADIVCLHSGELRVHFGNNGNAFPQSVVALTSVSGFAIVDVDRDGDLDLVAANGQVAVIRQVTPRRFAVVRSTGSVSGISSAADVDNDGVVDIATIGNGGAIQIIYGGR
jgi:hypothetical protein